MTEPNYVFARMWSNIVEARLTIALGQDERITSVEWNKGGGRHMISS